MNLISAFVARVPLPSADICTVAVLRAESQVAALGPADAVVADAEEVDDVHSTAAGADMSAPVIDSGITALDPLHIWNTALKNLPIWEDCAAKLQTIARRQRRRNVTCGKRINCR